MINNVVVHLTGNEGDRVRLAYAAPVARMFAAHLTGVFVNLMPDTIAFTEPAAAGVLKELWDESRRRGDAVAERLAGEFSNFGLAHELRRLDVFPGQAGSQLAAEVRLADLFVATRPYGEASNEASIAEAVLLGSGRGCLFVPPDTRPRDSYRTCLVAWNHSREAARAVAEAMPFLRQAEKVVVAIVEEHGASEQYHVEVGADVGRYMSRHDVNAEVRAIAGWDDAGEAILKEAKMTSADLIVMGGYGHSRLREWVLGGATRHALSEAGVPVLMAH